MTGGGLIETVTGRSGVGRCRTSVEAARLGRPGPLARPTYDARMTTSVEIESDGDQGERSGTMNADSCFDSVGSVGMGKGGQGVGFGVCGE